MDNLLYEWGFDTIGAATSIKQIFMDDTYVYAATVSGLSIIDVSSEQVVNYISMYNGCTTVWSDNINVFIGSSEGIDTFNRYAPLSVSSYISYPFINSKNVNHLHGNASVIMCCTDVGVNITRRHTNYTTYCSAQTASKCFVTTSNNYYYLLNNNNSINRINYNNNNWVTPDIVYTTSSGFLSTGAVVKDFFVTDKTSLSGLDNTIFIATASGVYVYDEGNNDYYMFNSPNISMSNDFCSIIADEKSNISSGKMYASTSGPGAALYVVNLSTKEVTDIYTIDREGATNETLLQEDIVDISITI